MYIYSAPDEDRDGRNVECWLNQQRYLGVGLLTVIFQFIYIYV